MNIKLQTEVGPIEIGFDPTKYKTKAGAAKAFYKALCKFAKEVYGQNPDIEIFIDNPEESEARGYGKNWRVCWEAGPYEWGLWYFVSGSEYLRRMVHRALLLI